MEYRHLIYEEIDFDRNTHGDIVTDNTPDDGTPFPYLIWDPRKRKMHPVMPHDKADTDSLFVYRNDHVIESRTDLRAGARLFKTVYTKSCA